MDMYDVASADDAWRALAQDFRESRCDRVETRLGTALEKRNVMIRISDPLKRWVVSRRPAMNPAFALAEVVWILSGDRSSRVINFWNPALPRYAGNGDEYHGAYGYRLRRHLGFDQLERAYEALRSNPDSRQVVLQIWDGSIDLPIRGGVPNDPDIPCNVCIFLKIRDGSLQWTQINRSNDLFLGFPHNVVQFTMIQEAMAGWMGIPVGDFVHYTDSIHVYEEHISSLAHPDTTFDHLYDSICGIDIGKNEWSSAFSIMYKVMSYFPESCPEFCSVTREIIRLPSACQDIMRVISADGWRRHGMTCEPHRIMEACNNKLLCLMWESWCKRVGFHFN